MTKIFQFFVSFIVLNIFQGCSSVPKISRNPPPHFVNTNGYALGQPPKQIYFEDDGRDFDRATVKENRERLEHQRRLKEAEYLHQERLQQIRHAEEEARALGKAGITVQPSAGSVSRQQIPPPPQLQAPRQSDPFVTHRDTGVQSLRSGRQSSIRSAPDISNLNSAPMASNAGGGGVRGFFHEWNRRFWDFSSTSSGGGVSGIASAGASGSVNFPETRFERKVKEFNGGSTFPSLATGVPSGTYVKSRSGHIGIAGAAQANSGLVAVLSGR